MESPSSRSSPAPTLGDTDLPEGRVDNRDIRGVEPGTVLGRYEARERIGRGGMGEVWLAHDTELDRQVAIKILRADRRGAGRSDRMRREAQAMARLRHPNVIAVHDVGTWHDWVFVAMEYVRGGTLVDWLGAKPRGVREIVEVFDQAARGLAAAHAAGLVHRDFKPDNVMVGEDGRVQVTDFGLARAPEAEAETRRPSKLVWDDVTGDPSDGRGLDTSSLVSQRLTATGAVLGTPAYMAPEQHAGTTTDARSDQFAFAIALYEALYGERPFGGVTVYEIAANVTAGEVRPAPRDSKVPLRLRKILLRALASERGDRYPNVEALREDLRRAITPRWRPWALPGIAAVTATGWLLLASGASTDPCADAGASIDAGWSDESESAAAAAFGRSELGFAADSLARFDARLSAYAASLQEAAVDACRATRVQGVQSQAGLDARLSCLRRREVAARALSRRAQAADDDFIVQAVAAATSLPSPAECSDPSRLAAADAPSASAETAALTDKLTEADIAIRLEKFDEAAPLVAEVLAVAEAGPPSALLIDALETRAAILAAAGESEQRRATAERAMWLAIEIGTEEHRARQAISLLHASIGLGDLDAGAQWAAQAQAELRRIGGGSLAQRLSLDVGLSRLHRARAEYPAAEAAARRSLELAPQDVVSPLRHTYTGHMELASVLMMTGRLEDSREQLQLAADAAREIYGPDHPKLADTMSEQAELASTMGDFDAALEYETAALKILDGAYGKSPERMMSALSRIALGKMHRGEFADALPFLQERLARLERANRTPTPQVAWAASTLGVALWYLKRYPEAEQMHRRAVDIAEIHRGQDHPETAMYRDNLATALERQGRVDEALALHERTLPVLEEAYGPDSTVVAVSLRDHARALTSAGRGEEAAAMLERSIRIFQKAAADPREEAETRFDLARALWEDEPSRPRAIGMAHAAKDQYRSVGDTGRNSLDEVEAWIAAHLDEPGTPQPPSPTDRERPAAP